VAVGPLLNGPVAHFGLIRLTRSTKCIALVFENKFEKWEQTNFPWVKDRLLAVNSTLALFRIRTVLNITSLFRYN
jgi:hypothetical protein